MLTAERLKQLLHYDPDSGLFTRLVRTAQCVQVGDIAGSVRKDGYVAVNVDGKRYKAHRMAFLYMTGEFPPDEIDHINGIRTDNRWVNLRPATDQQNSQNRKMPSTNKSGRKGVYWKKEKGKWTAEICVPLIGQRFLGYFDSRDEAAAMYAGAAALFHGPYVRIEALVINNYFVNQRV